jgi:hypothetical protein
MTYKRLTSGVLVAVVCAGVALSSFAQEVYSPNVVGFQKISASSQGLTMVSMPFYRATSTLDEVVGNQLYGHKSSTYADNINVWVPGVGYTNFFLKNDGKWYDFSNQRATNFFISTHMGFWINNQQKLSNEIVVVCGDVVDPNVITNPLVPGLSLVSYPFTTEIDINKSGLTNGYAHKSSTYADNISIWNFQTKAYSNYFLKTDKKWYDFANVVASNIMVGQGKSFWYRNSTSNTFNWVETRPYTL